MKKTIAVNVGLDLVEDNDGLCLIIAGTVIERIPAHITAEQIIKRYRMTNLSDVEELVKGNMNINTILADSMVQ